MNANIAQIKRIKITCKACKSEFITDIGNSLLKCVFCGQDFNIDNLNDPFLKLNEALHRFKSVQSAEIALICEEAQ